jgi:hypothetical protein
MLSMLDVSSMAHYTVAALGQKLELSSRALVSQRLFTRPRTVKAAMLSTLDV